MKIMNIGDIVPNYIETLNGTILQNIQIVVKNKLKNTYVSLIENIRIFILTQFIIVTNI